MSHLQTALRFSEWALEFVFFPPALVAVVFAVSFLIGAGQKQRPFQTGLWKPYHWFVLTHLLFFASAIAVGAVCAVTDPMQRHVDDPIAPFCLQAVLYGSFTSCAFWIWRMKGFRAYAISLMTLLELPIFGALLVAAVSISGVQM